MKRTLNVFSIIALVLTIIGALNWLLVGLFDFNLVTWISMGAMWLESAIYILVGIAGIFMIVWLCLANCNMVNDDERKNYSQYKQSM